jgi:putative transposase
MAAMKIIGNAASHECGRWLSNRADNSHQPFRRREGAVARFRDVKTLQKFASVHASIHNHFNHDRHNRRDIFKKHRPAALAGWRQLAARPAVTPRFHMPIAVALTEPVDPLTTPRPIRLWRFL